MKADHHSEHLYMNRKSLMNLFWWLRKYMNRSITAGRPCTLGILVRTFVRKLEVFKSFYMRCIVWKSSQPCLMNNKVQRSHEHFFTASDCSHFEIVGFFSKWSVRTSRAIIKAKYSHRAIATISNCYCISITHSLHRKIQQACSR